MAIKASSDHNASCCSIEKSLTIVFAFVLFGTALVCGYIGRVTLHILIWHIGPPMESNISVSHLSTLNGWLTPNCSNCNGTACHIDRSIDVKWIWAVFVVIITPYVLTILKSLLQMCFKTSEKNKTNEENKTNEDNKTNEGNKTHEGNKANEEQETNTEPVLCTKTFWFMIFTEFFHTVGLCILVFFVLPLFDPILASVVYMATSFLTPCIDFGSIVYRVFKNRDLDLLRVISDIFGIILQIAGITLLARYLNDGLMFGLFLISVILVSLKYWENCVHDKNSIIWQLQNPRPMETCIVYIFKVILTFGIIIVIYALKSTDSRAGAFSLFDDGQSIALSIFGGQTIDSNTICQYNIPFILSAINILCNFLCYASAKLACTINCQMVCFVPPLLLLPLLTTITIPVALGDPAMLTIGSCDLLFQDWCFNLGSMYDLRFLLSAGVLLYFSIICIVVPIWKDSGKRGKTGGVFVAPFYCGIFLELSLLKNRRQNDEYVDKNGETINSSESKKSDILCVCCATMWHEEEREMKQLLESFLRLDKQQRENQTNEDEKFDLEAHIFFDDAFIENDDDGKQGRKNNYVETFIKMVEEYQRSEPSTPNFKADDFEKHSPYGARLEWRLPKGNTLFVHLKNKNKVKQKKRWSQVMYMRYILEHKHKQPGSKFAAENIFILALDGDVKFEPEAVLSLMRRLKESSKIGAACGRIHPIGAGPMVWYQQFEYAIGHWLQKATEHVTGCVLCTPGCFGLFRGSSILKVLDTYSEEATHPRHYLQYDQGEDRWLCTLLLKQGMKIEYTAESDAYTFVPEGFYQFYNQRRRWTPSTIANIMDLLISWKEITAKNDNISVLYISYHLCLLISTLLTPGAIFMLIVGSIIISFQWIHSFVILIVNVIVVSMFMLACVCASTQKQLLFAAVLSCIYGIIMLIGLIGVVKDAADIGFCSITTILILFEAGVFIISAILHPKEWKCLLPGLIYFFALPAMSMLMFLYAIGNLNDVSWGTRETQLESESSISNSQEEMEEEEGHVCSFGKFCTCMLCPRNSYTKSILNKWKYLKDNPDVKRGHADKGMSI
ncbi:CHS1 [Mytilus edulis]|uniref:chitin synthase n=1 Tax=Mytilus edulis TaxID=6550 RepID=A0A8S3Q608_MYTED|nr:CHS1 [Mytilus edulis]